MRRCLSLQFWGVVPTLSPMVTGSPFFPRFFFMANFCLFCRKGKSSVVTYSSTFFSAFLGYKSRGASPRRDYVRSEEDGISMNRIV